MMKKLLSLLAVLAMTTMASAAIVPVNVGTPNQMDINSRITFDIVGAEWPAGQGIYIYTEGPGVLDITEAVNEVVAGELYDDASKGELEGYGIDITNVGLPVLWADTTIPQVPIPTIDGNIISSLGINSGAELGLVTITVFGDTDGEVLGTGAVEVVPEPITIALLSLGGLFLRRRT